MHYSVDHSLIGEQVDVKLTSSAVTVMHGGEVAAAHPRPRGRKGQYSTNVEHMPENHAALDGPWSPERFASWAMRIGPETASAIGRVLASRAIVEQSFVSCRDILGLSKTYAPALLRPQERDPRRQVVRRRGARQGAPRRGRGFRRSGGPCQIGWPPARRGRLQEGRRAGCLPKSTSSCSSSSG